MHPKEFHQQVDEARIVQAIAEVEKRTSGKIHVYVSHRKIEDALAQARRRFRHLGLHGTDHRNAVLIYLAPRTRKFAIIGDTAVHERCGEKLWEAAAETLGQDLKAGDYTAALLGAIRTLGEALAEHFPA